MLLRIVVEAEGDPLQAKEDLAMAQERYAPARVVEVAPIYRQEQMDPSATVNGGSRHTPSGVSHHLPPGGRQGRCAAGDMAILEGIPTEGVVGPFARADAALKAAMEANEEIRR